MRHAIKRLSQTVGDLNVELKKVLAEKKELQWIKHKEKQWLT